MPKIRCKCENIISLGEIPSSNQSLIISDVKFDNFQGVIDVEELYKEMKIVVHCQKCERLYIYWEGFSSIPDIYIKENDTQ
ncbi:MAG TPA: hypothetical protein VFR70_06215 [Flavobacterium sp.]|nr:hypothetical protein [Flavobacterium sp.]